MSAAHARAEPPTNGCDRSLVLVGRVGAAHGVKGEVRLTSFTADPLAIGGYGSLCDASGTRRLSITALRPLKDNVVVVRFAGVMSRTDAEALNGIALYLPRMALPAPAADEFYHADLIGLRAVDADGTCVGHVAHVLNYGGGDILEIVPIVGGDTLLLPFTTACVPHVDLAAKQIVIMIPDDVDADSSHESDGGDAAG